YAVPIQAIEEIIGCQEISLLPNVPDFIKGVINLRGDLVPIMDLRLKFRLEAREYNPLTVFLIVRVEEKIMGLVVDNVADVLVIDPTRVQKTPVFSASISTDFIEGVYKDAQNQMVILVNVAALTKPEEWDLIAA
ncbi:chemotaxis protein CheW, partial [archaeon]|nr:chemotaxis protein CheW [archaeon]